MPTLLYPQAPKVVVDNAPPELPHTPSHPVTPHNKTEMKVRGKFDFRSVSDIVCTIVFICMCVSVRMYECMCVFMYVYVCVVVMCVRVVYQQFNSIAN